MENNVHYKEDKYLDNLRSHRRGELMFPPTIQGKNLWASAYYIKKSVLINFHEFIFKKKRKGKRILLGLGELRRKNQDSLISNLNFDK